MIFFVVHSTIKLQIKDSIPHTKLQEHEKKPKIHSYQNPCILFPKEICDWLKHMKKRSKAREDEERNVLQGLQYLLYRMWRRDFDDFTRSDRRSDMVFAGAEPSRFFLLMCARIRCNSSCLVWFKNCKRKRKTCF